MPKKLRIGIICPSEIAFRRFLPSLRQVEEAEYAGVAVAAPEEWGGEGMGEAQIHAAIARDREKAEAFRREAGGRIFDSYSALIHDGEVDAVYLPLPPALHFKWAQAALEAGKHALVEKPFTTSLPDTEKLLALAGRKGLGVHENYMFLFHGQIATIDRLIEAGEIGKVRLYRISFGFPKRAAGDFRYNKALGGGALLDCGGYTIRYAAHLLGKGARLLAASSLYEEGQEVDMSGSATLVNDAGLAAQVAFGMDNAYKCELEAWGSTGCLRTSRVLTAPDGFVPQAVICRGAEEKTLQLPADAAFVKSIRHFCACVRDDATRRMRYDEILAQGRLIDAFQKIAAA
ncbi:MAG: Gfo/Idh/MocA family oxidoreductase [Bacteroidales bacterium]|nr:Gfo/Idh/MocA family oxidoreductase [Bacteroidales bacterium]